MYNLRRERHIIENNFSGGYKTNITKISGVMENTLYYKSKVLRLCWYRFLLELEKPFLRILKKIK